MLRRQLNLCRCLGTSFGAPKGLAKSPAGSVRATGGGCGSVSTTGGRCSVSDCPSAMELNSLCAGDISGVPKPLSRTCRCRNRQKCRPFAAPKSTEDSTERVSEGHQSLALGRSMLQILTAVKEPLPDSFRSRRMAAAGSSCTLCSSCHTVPELDLTGRTGSSRRTSVLGSRPFSSET